MNKERRARVRKYLDAIEDIQSNIDYLQDEERDAFESLPDSLQGSERGQQMEEYADELGEAYLILQEVIDRLYDIVEG